MDTKRLADKLASWLKDTVSPCGCKGVVLGMSGGIDSSVLAVLCHRAFPQSTLGVLMPCYSLPEDMEHAQAVAARFSIPTKTVVLDSVLDALCQVLPNDNIDLKLRRLVEANIKSRLRMVTLYYFANKLGYMVVGSGNRSELSVGYFTKYGDSGVDILPLGNLVKEEIRELARFLGIPQPIIDKPPSAGLWEGQTDESEMGFTYAELDRYLLTGKAPAELKKRLEAKIATNKHKCQLPPIPNF